MKALARVNLYIYDEAGGGRQALVRVYGFLPG